MRVPVFHIEPGYQRALAQLGLDSLEQVLSFRGERIKDQRGRRDVLKVDAHRDDGTPIALFIKRMTRSYLKDGVQTRFLRGKVVSKARIEFENTQRVIAAGIAASRPVAFGEDCGALREKASVIITECVAGQPLDDFLASRPREADRRALMWAVGQWIRQVHDRGISFPDFFARHIFVSGDRFALIDLARCDFRTEQPIVNRARDLAALHASVPLRDIRLTDRLRTLKSYQPERARRRELVRYISRRMRTLLRRRKFAEFSRPALKPS